MNLGIHFEASSVPYFVPLASNDSPWNPVLKYLIMTQILILLWKTGWAHEMGFQDQTENKRWSEPRNVFNFEGTQVRCELLVASPRLLGGTRLPSRRYVMFPPSSWNLQPSRSSGIFPLHFNNSHHLFYVVHLFCLLDFSLRISKLKYEIILTSWLMEPRGAIPHLQRLSNNPYREPNQSNSSYWCLFL